MKKAYKKWRRGKKEKEEYLSIRRKFREVCKRNEAARLERWEKEIKNTRTEAQIWKIIKKGRKVGRKVGANINLEEAFFAAPRRKRRR